MQSQNNPCQKRLLNLERRTWLALVLASGLVGFGFGNGHTTQNAIEDITAKAGCEHHRANVATKLALQPTIVDPKSIPKDNCSPKS